MLSISGTCNKVATTWNEKYKESNLTLMSGTKRNNLLESLINTKKKKGTESNFDGD